MAKRQCLECFEVFEGTGARCPLHARSANASWSADRDRGQQRRFRELVLIRAGHRCEGLDTEGLRCTVRKGLQAHHMVPGVQDPSTGLALCRKHHRAVDSHAR